MVSAIDAFYLAASSQEMEKDGSVQKRWRLLLLEKSRLLFLLFSEVERLDALLCTSRDVAGYVAKWSRRGKSLAQVCRPMDYHYFGPASEPLRCLPAAADGSA